MLPTGLSMLWEAVDARTALRERFGFDSEDAAADWCRSVLAERWGIAAEDCTRILISDRNVIAWFTSEQGGLVVKWSVDADAFPRLETSARLLQQLDARGIPVAGPIPDRHGAVRPRVSGPSAGAPSAGVSSAGVSSAGVSIAVLPEVAGEWLDVADPVAVHEAGACLARLHGALATIPWEGPAPARFDDPHAEIARWLRDDDRGRAPGPVRRLGGLLAAAPPLPGAVQPVHNDFRAANVLTRGSSIVAVLDFDEVILAHPVFDLAKASVYLATRFTDWGPTPPSVRERFRVGYDSERPLSDAESAWFEIVALWLGVRAVPEDDRAGWAAAL